MKKFFKRICFSAYNRFFPFNFNKEYEKYTIFFLTGEVKEFDNYHFSAFKEHIKNNLYNRNLIKIKAK